MRVCAVIGMIVLLSLFAAGPLAAQQSNTDDISPVINSSAARMTNDGMQGVGRNEDQSVSRKLDQDDNEDTNTQSTDQDGQSGDEDNDDSPSKHHPKHQINR